MTENDVRNYLEKIYSLKVCNIRSDLRAGEMPMGKKNYIVKKYDYRQCYVSLPVGTTFTHPGEDLFLVNGQAPEVAEMESAIEEVKNAKNKFRKSTVTTGGHLPSWWSSTG